MKRKLIGLLATAALALTAMAFMAGGAAADVEVANPGEYELTGNIVYGSDGYTSHYCDAIDITVDINSDGSAVLTPTVYGFVSGVCENTTGTWFDPCYDQPWAGQIVGPGDEEHGWYEGTGDFELMFWMCTDISDPAFGGYTVQRFSIDDQGTSETWNFYPQALTPDAPPPDNGWKYTGYGYADDLTELDITMLPPVE